MKYASLMRFTNSRDASCCARALSGVFGLLLSLGGCSGEVAPSAANVGTVTAKPTSPTFDQIPDCRQMEAILGDLVADMVLTVRDGADGIGMDGRFDHPDEYGVSCVWLTKKTFSPDPYEAIREGSFGMSITVNITHPLEEAALRSVGLVFEDPRVQAIGGFVLDDPNLNLADQLAINGPMVVVGSVTVTMGTTGAFLQKVESMRNITNDRGIEAALALHNSLR